MTPYNDFYPYQRCHAVNILDGSKVLGADAKTPKVYTIRAVEFDIIKVWQVETVFDPNGYALATRNNFNWFERKLVPVENLEHPLGNVELMIDSEETTLETVKV